MKLNNSIKELFIKETINSGMGTISVQSLCSILDIKRQTFYYYYRDIYDLADSILDDYKASFNDLSSDFNYLRKLLEFYNDNARIFSEFINSSLNELFVSFSNEMLMPYVEKKVMSSSSSENLSNASIKEIALFYTRGLSLLINDYLKVGEEFSESMLENKIGIYLDDKNINSILKDYYENRRNI